MKLKTLYESSAIDQLFRKIYKDWSSTIKYVGRISKRTSLDTPGPFSLSKYVDSYIKRNGIKLSDQQYKMLIKKSSKYDI